jgi:hypothetical protein
MVEISQTASGQIRAPELNVDLGILVGLLLTDGWINKKVFGFASTSESLLHLFKEKTEKLFGKHHFVEFVDKRNGVHIIEVNNTKISKKLFELIKPLGKKQLPHFFFKLNDNSLKEILKFVFSCDGSICLGVKWNKQEKRWKFTRKVKLTSWDSEIREGIAHILRKLKINCTVENRDVVIERENEMIKFQKEIRFVNGVKISGKSKNWKGFEKNQILDLAIKTFKLKKKDLQHFKTKEEVINFLKSLLEAPVADAERVQVPRLRKPHKLVNGI